MYDEIKFERKAWGSGNGDCPSRMKVPGGYVIVGKIHDAATLAQIDAEGRAHNSGIGPDETAVFVPADVIDNA